MPLVIISSYAIIKIALHMFQKSSISATAAPIGLKNLRAPLVCQICDCRGYFATKCRYRWDYAYQAHADITQALATEDVDTTLYINK